MNDNEITTLEFGTLTLPPPESTSFAPKPTIFAQNGEVIQGSVDVIGDGLNEFYHQSINFYPLKIGISVVLIITVIIGVFKIL